jgi:hypothetical protein
MIAVIFSFVLFRKRPSRVQASRQIRMTLGLSFFHILLQQAELLFAASSRQMRFVRLHRRVFRLHAGWGGSLGRSVFFTSLSRLVLLNCASWHAHLLETEAVIGPFQLDAKDAG